MTINNFKERIEGKLIIIITIDTVFSINFEFESIDDLLSNENLINFP